MGVQGEGKHGEGTPSYGAGRGARNPLHPALLELHFADIPLIQALGSHKLCFKYEQNSITGPQRAWCLESLKTEVGQGGRRMLMQTKAALIQNRKPQQSPFPNWQPKAIGPPVNSWEPCKFGG